MEEEPIFAVPTPWSDLWGVTSNTIAFSVEDYLRDALMTKKEGDRVLEANWPPRCCVCSEEANHTESVDAEIVLPPSRGIHVRKREVKLIASGIPHCANHSKGVSFGSDNRGQPTQLVFGLLFRSYSYRNEFWKLNPWRWPGDVPTERRAITIHFSLLCLTF